MTYWVYNSSDLANVPASWGDEINLMQSEIYSDQIMLKSGVLYQSGVGGTVITNFKRATNWNIYNGNIYWVQIDVNDVKQLKLDGKVRGMGRYPNNGYVQYTSHDGKGSISGFNINGSYVGAEVVIRKHRYILDRHKITSMSNGIINFSSDNFKGINNVYEPTDGNGFFIQNSFFTLDQHGDWYYNKNEGRLYMYFDYNPFLCDVRVSSAEILFNANAKQAIKLSNISIEGADIALSVDDARDITIDNCTLKNSNFGLYGTYCKNIVVYYSMIDSCTSGGILLATGTDNVRVEATTVQNCGMIAGMGNSGDSQYSSITIVGNNIVVRLTKVLISGFNAIYFEGSDVLIEKNLIKDFCLIKDDGGGIYTFANKGVEFYNREVRYNIVVNATGNFDGGLSDNAFGEAGAIYLDGNATNMYIHHNFCANGTWSGILDLANSNNRIEDNVVYNFKFGITISQYTNLQNVRNLYMVRNKFISRTPDQTCMLLHQYFAPDDYRNYGTMDYNMYFKASNIYTPIVLNGVSYPNGQWRSIGLGDWRPCGQDTNSTGGDTSLNNPDAFRMEYNYSGAEIKIPLDGFYKGVDFATYDHQVTIPPYSGIVMVKINN